MMLQFYSAPQNNFTPKSIPETTKKPLILKQHSDNTAISVILEPKQTENPAKPVTPVTTEVHTEQTASNDINPQNGDLTGKPLDHQLSKSSIHDLTANLKADFLKQEKAASTKQTTIQKFARTLKEGETVSRDGMYVENKNLFDGRPVSKVHTPFGTYCLQHRKPGERDEFVPKTIPMSCGNL